MSIERNIHFVWFGQWPLEPYASWRRQLMEMNPGYSFWLWDENTIGQLGLDYEMLKAQFPKPAGVSNAVRLHAVYAKGGMYTDADFIPIKPVDPFFVFCGDAWVAEQENGRKCNAIFAAKKEHPWVKWQIDNMHLYTGIAPYWGPDLMTVAPMDGVTIIPQRTVYPYLFDAPLDKRVPHEDTILQHAWHGSWLPNKH